MTDHELIQEWLPDGQDTASAQPNPQNDDDELVALFFSDHQFEVEDSGFSRQVMRQLPSRSVRLNRLWTIFCVGVAVVMAFLCDWNRLFIQLSKAVISQGTEFISMLLTHVNLHQTMLLGLSLAIMTGLWLTQLVVSEK